MFKLHTMKNEEKILELLAESLKKLDQNSKVPDFPHLCS
ncbi:hypothetical protein M23134_07806 [Microscilla marina ATCC 23134]|uniref:Uncharacterized protein n=1 Tax=Microscilla marina ATCC 23134 TaxID=313606 RepID=A1ZLF4_MICM2|nr:hypothetical protein M23134_07806 [Microscilla marina ATCC 23134]